MPDSKRCGSLLHWTGTISNNPIPRARHKATPPVACLVLLAVTAGSVRAVDTFWQAAVTPASWSVPSNWTNGVPTSSPQVNAWIQNGKTAVIDPGPASAYALYLDNGGVSHTAGTLTIGQVYYIGSAAGTTASYTLSGTAALVTNDYGIVGRDGTGLFTQAGGSSKAMFLTLGNGNTGDGAYNLSAGEVEVSNNLIVGNAGTGEFLQTGGTATLKNASWLGYFAGSNGTYRLEGGTLTTLGDFYVGYFGTGHFINSGGSHQGTWLDLGWQKDGSSTYELTAAGQLTANFLQYSRGGGRFVQTGGSSTINNFIHVSGFQGSVPSYEISGGTLNTPELAVGRNDFFQEAGRFAITGGTAAINVGAYAQAPLGKLFSTIDATGLSPINVSGAAVLDGTWEIIDAGAAPGHYVVLEAVGGISENFTQVVLPSSAWSWGVTGNQLWVEHIPEPATLVLFAPAAALLLRRKNRH